ncbi:MAG: UDP-N-acetylmuramate--L-alanine ligase [Caldilineaceae bacterium]|nr:UDP-N-acetylmuramate--L-alanine ligase [Caldilineaceae bacterium]MBP8110461.1 UDP-N-acetylmuramate--L-alanine ligase [Caldilineaceae bacterium]MBP8123451.1 UDP-N-acetylmuramate--L-alanine ligase [Caldilineaceae bacterium]MBP9074410.1 UDP-N-acetylmuramate--L-alanine ligase [Caldilineaceae bacterium]
MSQQTTWQEKLAAADPTLRVHLIGIGGTGLSAIATVLVEMGVSVSGSDRQPNSHTQRLALGGVHIFLGQQAANLVGMAPDQRPDVVLISSAIDPHNPERQAAESMGLPVVKRNQFLPALLANRRVIAIAGTHGKSTTTAMTVQVLRQAGLDVGYIIGTVLTGFGNAAAGTHPYFVIEADEYDHMFLGLHPALAVITNVEWDHPDCYPTPGSYRRAFMQFADLVPQDGLLISCADDPGAEEIRAYRTTHGQSWITYGLNIGANLRALAPLSGPNGGYVTTLSWQAAPAGQISLQVPGLHNLRNALAVLAVAQRCGVPLADAAATLADFRGTDRRFELKGSAKGVIVYDDYAHHPTEVRATLSGARHRHWDQRIWAVIQPHTFSRTRTVLAEMARSFSDADRVIVTDIYASRETDDGTVSAQDLVAASDHPAIRHVGDLAQAAATLAAEVQPGDVVITLGAGDGYRVGELLLEQLSRD